MFTLSAHHKFNLFSQPTDMRKGFDGLSGMVTNILHDNPRSGEVFIFINKNHHVKCPFHKDNKPSLRIYPETNTYTCFGILNQ